MDKIAEVEIYSDGDLYRIVIRSTSGEEFPLEGEDLEELLEQLSTEMEERFQNR